MQVTVLVQPSTGRVEIKGHVDNPQLCADILAAGQRRLMSFVLSKQPAAKQGPQLLIAKELPQLPRVNGRMAS